MPGRRRISQYFMISLQDLLSKMSISLFYLSHMFRMWAWRAKLIRFYDISLMMQIYYSWVIYFCSAPFSREKARRAYICATSTAIPRSGIYAAGPPSEIFLASSYVVTSRQLFFSITRISRHVTHRKTCAIIAYAGHMRYTSCLP